MDFTTIVSILVNFIQVKFQGKLISPFETHPVATCIAICSLLLHFLLLHLAERAPPSSGRAPPCDGASHLLIHFAGSISVASLAWLLLHDSSHSVLWLFVLLLLLPELELLLQSDIQVAGAKRTTILDVNCSIEYN
ncbi:hypothetical protein EUGRSUZ_D00561 [Eucalyptus grandis]|uniref:Uncharacterized protein n=1 Tax=Eucalyptus grandis TaxID=71139 RepID=A0A059CD46_EUCGR|nr:hypothetical protein EUGRSUZ_D00561 [Eucalyptus grandis]